MYTEIRFGETIYTTFITGTCPTPVANAELLLDVTQLASHGLRVDHSASHGVHMAVHGVLHVGRSSGGAVLKSQKMG